MLMREHLERYTGKKSFSYFKKNHTCFLSTKLFLKIISCFKKIIFLLPENFFLKVENYVLVLRKYSSKQENRVFILRKCHQNKKIFLKIR